MTSAEARARIQECRQFNAFISLTTEDGPGPVVAVKDIVRVRGTITTGGGVLLPKIADANDAPVIARMRCHGCVVIGKTNLHEWAYGVTNENPHYGAVLNPHDLRRVPGGSSGGSAVAVALGMCDWALGSDTGGSIRIPASLCGVVGIKPTYGTVATNDVIPVSASLDTLGPLARDVPSAARALEAMCDLTGLVPTKAPSLQEIRLAVPAGWITDLDDETNAVWRRVAADVPAIPFPNREVVSAVARTIMQAEASAYHRRWLDETPDRYGDDVRGRLQQGLSILAVDYIRALHTQIQVRAAVEEAMGNVDAVVLPATATVAPFRGASDSREPLTRFTRPFNATGHPVVTVPGPGAALPVGVQVVGHWGHDAEVIRIAWALEQTWR